MAIIDVGLRAHAAKDRMWELVQAALRAQPDEAACRVAAQYIIVPELPYGWQGRTEYRMSEDAIVIHVSDPTTGAFGLSARPIRDLFVAEVTHTNGNGKTRRRI